MKTILFNVKEFISNMGLTDSVSTGLSAILILLVGWAFAKITSKIIYKALKKTHWDEKVMGQSGKETDVNLFFSKMVYYVIMLFVMLIALEALGLGGILDPLKDMLSKLFDFIPNILAAGIMGFIGYVLAKFVSNLISMAGTFIDNIVKKTGFSKTEKIIEVLKKVVFIFILFPFIIQALDALNLKTITDPAKEILNDLIASLPNVLGAAAIIAIFTIGAKFLTSLLKGLLKSMDFDLLPEKLQLTGVIGDELSLSDIASGLAFFFLVFFGVISGVEVLQFDRLTEILNTVLNLTSQILFSLVILVLGNFISVLIYNTLSKSEENKFIASVVRFGILGLFLSISLRFMGIANSIVELAFGLTLGSIAVVVALAYGLGGKEAAGEHMKSIIDKIRNKS